MTQTQTTTRFHLTEDQLASFDRDGYLVLKGWITGPLLEMLQGAGDRWIKDGLADEGRNGDFVWAKREVGKVLFRVNYLHEKGEAASLAMLGAPEVLAVVESLCGPNFVPTYESMVFKMEGDGEKIRWHQDSVHAREHRVVNFDLYLDPSRRGAGALWVIPGSQRAPFDACAFEAEHGWDAPGAVEVEMEPGDVLLHDTMVVHGSPRALGAALRRTIYYEFRAAEMIAGEGPWDDEWTQKRLRLIPLAGRVHAELLPDAPRFDWNPTVARPASAGDDVEAELKVAHVVHSSGSFCSATSTV